MSTIHDLKIGPFFFSAVSGGQKKQSLERMTATLSAVIFFACVNGMGNIPVLS
ncbi:hypothetical protein [Pantoea agglomerans]|uniref:hypothetical protein n=1 Tax=Enterobacter agglomerans TaxID=549 RepID=UPI001F34A45E|nr:hypothetical protein [Pantoea agglomerans]